MRMRFDRIREQLRSSLWFIPTLGAAGALFLSVVSLALDRYLLSSEISLVLGFTGSADGARSVLSVVATSMITLGALVFTILIVVLQLASSQFSPRALRTFLRDRDSQVTLAAFVGTFIYALMIIRAIRSPVDQIPGFVPSLSVSVGFGLALFSLGSFVWYINSTARSIRVTSIITSVADETRELIDRLHPDPLDEPRDDSLASIPEGLPDAVIEASQPGVVTAFDESGLIRAAAKSGCVLVAAVSVGDFVPRGGPLLEVHGPGDDLGELRGMVELADERSMRHDLAFGFRQLVDIAERALSPGINDPTTAVQVIDQLHDLLRRLAGRRFRERGRFDSDGALRLVVRQMSWDGYVSLAMDEIRHSGASSIQVLRRLRAMLQDLRGVVIATRLPAVERELRLLDTTIARSFPDLEDRDSAAEPDPQGMGA